MSGILQTRDCRECQRAFSITHDEATFLQDIAVRTGRPFRLPLRCLPCRKARREADVVTTSDPEVYEHFACVDCGTEFPFGGRDRVYFAARGWPRPTRCRPCRDFRRQERHGHGAARTR